MAKQSDFKRFLSNIEPSQSTIEYISSVQNNLRSYLKNHISYSCVYKDSFLSGSYAKHTSIRPVKNDKKRDVDIIVVTNYSTREDPKSVMDELLNALLDSSTYKTAKIQHHSIGLELSAISVDIVPVVVDENDDEILWVGDSESGEWAITDPKGHKEWSTKTNEENDGKYKPLVKLFKWWRRVNCPSDMKYPKGITLEKIIADNIGDSRKSYEELMIETAENIISNYKEDYADLFLLPSISDPSEKLEDNNLLAGYTSSDFNAFINKLVEHMQLLNDEGTNNSTWRTILGAEFPAEASSNVVANTLICKNAYHREKPLWPWNRGGAAFITLTVQDDFGNIIDYCNNGSALKKGYTLFFNACTGVKKPFTVMWQVTNTGEEARSQNCLRGNFEPSNIGLTGRKEMTSYTGTHSVQCFIIKRGVCVAKSSDYIINIE